MVLNTLMLIILAGAAGGFANSLIANRKNLFNLETLGAVLLGALAGVVYWITEGPLDKVVIIPKPSTPPSVQLTWGDLSLVFALGTVGGKWLTDYADKTFFKKAAGEAAAKNKDEQVSRAIQNTRRGQEALDIVESRMR
jgi:uncharacterized membrane protein